VLRQSRNSLIAVALMAVIGLLGKPAAVEGQDPTHDELRRLNTELLEATIVRRDSAALARGSFDEVIVIPPGGIVENKAEALRGVRAFEVAAIAVTDTRVMLQDNTAVVTSKLVLDGEIRGVGRVGPLRVMSVFVRDSVGWRLLARSLTPCREQAVIAGRC
jgi:hypothetical protein